MKQIYILTALLGIAMTSMSAQVNDATPQGYVQRGELMFAEQNYSGCIDHMSQAKQGILSQQDNETADYYMALSALNIGKENAINLIDAFLHDYPSSAYRAEMALAAGDYYFTRHNYALALSKYKDVESRQLNDAKAEDCRYRMAYCQMKLADYEKAQKGFASLVNTRKYGNAAAFYQGYIAYAEGDYARAEDLLSKVDNRVAPGNMADYYRSQIYFAREDYAKALTLAQSLLDSDAETQYVAEAYRIAGESQFNLGRDKESYEYLRRYEAMTDNCMPSAMYAMGVCEYRIGDYDSAVEHLAQAVAGEDKTAQAAYLYLGQAYYRQGKPTAALLALEQAKGMGCDAAVKESASYNYIVVKSQGCNAPYADCAETAESFLMEFPSSAHVSQVQEYVVKGLMGKNDYEKALLTIATFKNPTDEVKKDKQRVLLTLASRDVDAGRVKQALTRLQKAREITPADKEVAAECQLLIADCYYRQGNYDQAAKAYLEYINSISSTHQNCALAYYNLGYCRFNQGRYDDAIVNFTRVTRNQGKLSKAHVADAYNRIGDCHYYQSQFAKATENYNKAIEINPSSGDYALYQNALMRGHNRDYKGKIEDLNAVIKQYPNSALIPSAMLEKADAYTALNDTENAVTTYRQLVKKYPDSEQAPNALLQLAIIYGNSGRSDKAIEAYKDVISTYPKRDEAQVAMEDLKRLLAAEGRLGEYAQYVKNVPNAPQLSAEEADQLTFSAAENAYLNGQGIAQLKNYVTQYPDGAYQPQALHYLCQAADESGNYEQALKYASEIVNRYPDNVVAEGALAVMADAQERQGQVEKALATYQRLEQQASTPVNVKSARMGILRIGRDLGRHSEVIGAADRLLASPEVHGAEVAEIRFVRAYALAAVDRGDEAVVDWAALASNPDDVNGAKSAYYLGQYYYDKGNLKKSRQVVEALIDANTPHQYWLARAFILLSDVNRKEGKTFEADEYLKSLKESYPGNETDIFIMIDQRLK